MTQQEHADRMVKDLLIVIDLYDEGARTRDTMIDSVRSTIEHRLMQFVEDFSIDEDEVVFYGDDDDPTYDEEED